MQKDIKIHIIGAGISGLIAAKTLEKHGYTPVILEASDSPGGRVKTDIENTYLLDHGFQVLLTQYPSVKKHLDLKALELQKLSSGAHIFSSNGGYTLADPLRERSLLFATIASKIGTLRDKYLLVKLQLQLRKTTVAAIFKQKSKPTHVFLEEFGFSKAMIETFFRPFFSGIFLEKELQTCSRMFCFIYKMFAQGHAAIPKKGMQEIPKQLAKKLKNTQIKYNTRVKNVTHNTITLTNNTKIHTDYTILAIPEKQPIIKTNTGTLAWNGCHTFYFEVKKRVLKKRLIGLIADKNALISTVFYPSSIQQSPKEYICVTCVGIYKIPSKQLEQNVIQELKHYCGIEVVKTLKRIDIPKALPKKHTLLEDVKPRQTKISDRVYSASDALLNPSLHAAMISAERAAQAVMEDIDKKSLC